MKFLIVGAGPYGCTCAHELNQAGHLVQVIDDRPRLGGHSADQKHMGFHDRVPTHGAHIFHTHSKMVWDYVNLKVAFRPYVHTVIVNDGSRLLPLPINLVTLSQVVGVADAVSAKRAIREDVERAKISQPSNFQEQIISQIGPTLYEAMVRGYTQKVWSQPPQRLPVSMAGRIRIRFTNESQYFDDPFQGLPVHGYDQLWQSLLEAIPVELGTHYDASMLSQYDHIIYTGSIDSFFKIHEIPCERLPFRSSTFIHRTVPDKTGIPVVNFTRKADPLIRQYDWASFGVNQPLDSTLVTDEFPDPLISDPTHPVHTVQGKAIYADLLAKSKVLFPTVTFGGRLGQFAYWDMDQTIGAALRMVKEKFLDSAS